MNTSETTVAVEAAETYQNSDNPGKQGLSKGAMLASIIAGIGASTCCIGPLVLLAMGVSGSWIGNLSAFEPYRPIFIVTTLVFLGMAFRKLYLVPQSCTIDAPCSTPSNRRKQRITFWIISIVVLTIMSFPWYGAYLLD